MRIENPERDPLTHGQLISDILAFGTVTLRILNPNNFVSDPNLFYFYQVF